MWIVECNMPKGIERGFNDWLWPNDYFPRLFYYKKDALELKKQVEKRGVTAEIKNRNKK